METLVKMPSGEELSKAASILQRIQEQLQKKGDTSHDGELQAMISLMESPVFRQMVQLQAAIQQLKEEVWQCYFLHILV